MPYLLDEGGLPLLDEGGEFLLEEFSRPIPSWTPPPRSQFSIDLCQGWRRIAEAPAAVFDGVIRNTTQGEWQLTGSVAALTFQDDHTIADVDTIRVVRDTGIVFAGEIAPVASGVGGLTIQASPTGEHFTLTGPDAWSVLASRVCYPTPSTEQPWADSHDIRTGLASTCAAGYILNNAGNLATPDRQIPGLTVIDEGVGATGEWSARLQPLDIQTTRICRDGGIVARLAVGYDGALTVTLANPNDISHTVVLSDQGDLINITHIRAPATASFVIAGGQGNLTARTFASAGAVTGAARREVFSDQSSLTTAAEVAQSASTRLARGGSALTVRAEVTDNAAIGLRYLIDYNLGDTIAAEIQDVRYPVVVESVTIHVGPDRAVIRPVLGDATPDLVTGILKDIAGLSNRLDSQIS